MKINRMTRRMFLQGAGNTLVAIPFLQSMLPGEAWAQSAGATKRYVALLSHFEAGHNSIWLPRPAGADIYNLPQPAQTFNPGNGHHPIRYQSLRDFAPTNTSNLATLYGNSLSPYLEQINIMRGVDTIARGGHDKPQILGGLSINDNWRGNLELIETMDHILNSNRTFNPNGLPHMFLGHRGEEGWSHGRSGTTVNMATPIRSMSAIYNALFDNGNFPEAGETTTAHPKRDVLSRVLEDYNRIRNSRYISSADRSALNDAMDQLSDVQRSLQAVTTQACSHRDLNRSGNSTDAHSDPVIGRALANLIAAAIMCDTARTIVVGVHFPSNGHTIDGQNFDHQFTSHQPFSQVGGRFNWERMGERQAYPVRNVFAPLVQALSSAVDPSNGQSYLYNSLVHYSTMNSQLHGWCSTPTILAGNAGGAINSGNYIDYSNRALGPVTGADTFSTTPGDSRFSNNWPGIVHNRLLVTIMQAMGLSPADYENDALNSQLYNRTDIGSQNANLSSIGGFGYAYRMDITNQEFFQRVTNKSRIQNYDLRQFRHPLAIPG